MLVVVVALFAVLWLPYRALVVYNSLAPTSRMYRDLWFMLFCRLMIYINSAINPILYNALSGKFRRAFHAQLTCLRRHSRIFVPSVAYAPPCSEASCHNLVGSRRIAVTAVAATGTTLVPDTDTCQETHMLQTPSAAELCLLDAANDNVLIKDATPHPR
jgi:hypothetical protein